MSPKQLRAIGFVFVAAVFAATLGLLTHELRHVDYHDILRHVGETPPRALVGALVFTTLSYLVLTVYDCLGLRYAGQPLPYRKTAFASFISYVFSHNLGLSMFGGLAFRYRIYSSWDLTAADVARVAVFCGVTFWLGLLTLGGVVFSLWPPPALPLLPVAPWGYRLVGLAFLAAAAVYVALCFRGIGQLRVRHWRLALPSGRMALAQAGIAALDWMLACETLYLLLPADLHLPWYMFLSIYMLAAVAGLVAHVPAGLGVIETVMIMALAPHAGAEVVLGSLLVYRAVYYLAPLLVAVVWLGLYELANATGALRGRMLVTRRWFEALIPRVFSVLVFAAGAVLLLSSATPAIPSRLEWLASTMPLAVVDGAHLLASVAGAGLLIAARGLQRRLGSAYRLAQALLAAGIAGSLAKGLDYEAALILSLVLLLLAPCRRYFYRQASLFDARLTPGWTAAIALTLVSMIWLAAFANKHVAYASELWWSFTFAGDAARSLRACFGAVACTLLVGLLYLRRASPALAPVTGKSAGDAVEALVAASDRPDANLAFLGDKTLLLNAARTALVMYAVEGRSWVAMGGPVGSDDACLEMIWKFRDLVDRYGGWPVFYQIDGDRVRPYVEAGFSLLKIGEAAIVDLSRLGPGHAATLPARQTVDRFSQDGWQLEVLPPASVDALLPQLARLSETWLAVRGVREKRFAHGYFDPAYLRHFPLAVARRDGHVAAFANLWQTGTRAELALDLMRHAPEAPPGIVDFMMIQVMEWGRKAGFRTFNLGIVPCTEATSRLLAPFWRRLDTALCEHGEHAPAAAALKEFKETLSPAWRPQYLASAGGRTLPAILDNVATLITGGTQTSSV